jgi:hypothetical protein
MKKALFTAGFALAMITGLVYAANMALSIPDVYVSYSTGECVKVVNYTDENFTCDNYPSKFNHVWVQ